MSTDGDASAELTDHERALLDALTQRADTLDALADTFRATAGERSADLAYVYADCARGLRELVHEHRRLDG